MLHTQHLLFHFIILTTGDRANKKGSRAYKKGRRACSTAEAKGEYYTHCDSLYQVNNAFLTVGDRADKGRGDYQKRAAADSGDETES